MAGDIIGLLKNGLTSFMREEAKLLKDVGKEVEEIKHELTYIHVTIKKADQMAETKGDNLTDGLKEWARELRELAFEAEDIITEYTYHMRQSQPQPPQPGFNKCLQGIASFFFFFCSKLKRRHDLAWQIEDINMRRIRIIDRGEGYGFRASSIIEEVGSTSTAQNDFCNLQDPREASIYAQEAQLVGIGSPNDDLCELLKAGLPQRTVISLVGMGGSGKATLARQVYNQVQGSFMCHAWVSVPQPYSVEQLLKTLVRELFPSTTATISHDIDSTMDKRKLREEIGKYLHKKSYLVIFDDVWKEDFWDDIKFALIDDNVGARIMITTRLTQVATSCTTSSPVHVHKMKPLPPPEAWDLFCKKAFRPTGQCPGGLIDMISGEIVERCEGLPLAIAVIGGLLSTKNKNINEWRIFRDTHSSELGNNVHLARITNILLLSYYELPYHLRNCLLYFVMYPRGKYIKYGTLVRQWIAEGFVGATEDETLEEVAQKYMNELVNRSLVEASSTYVSGKVRECRVHDLLHDIIIKKAIEVSFCRVLLGNTESRFGGGVTRRLSVTINNSNAGLQSNNFHHVHSVIVFWEDDILNSAVHAFLKNFKFVKVLDFGDAKGLCHLPDNIGNLFDLRYLSVRDTRVKTLPRSMEKLENLETLDLKRSLVYEIPVDMINKLKNLRHLSGYRLQGGTPFAFVGIKLAGGSIGCLKALQKLGYIEADGEGVDGLFKELKNLTQLRSLAISKMRREDGMLLCVCVENMILLESLFVSSTSENEVIDLEYMSVPPKYLGRLVLWGRLLKLPEWFTRLQNIVRLTLDYSMLEDDPLEILQNMNSLSEVHIGHDAYVGEKLCSMEGVFPNLKKLQLLKLSRLSSLIIEETALPRLEELCIGHCPQMKEVPSGLQPLKNLKTLLFLKVPVEFVLFQDFRSIYHVPQVGFSFKNDKGQIEVINLPIALMRQIQYFTQRKVLKELEQATASRSTRDEQSREVEEATTSGITAEDHV